MLPLLLAVLRSYAPYITLPVAAVIGIIGYKVEGLVSDKYTPYERNSIEEKREERLLDENLSKDSIEVDSPKTDAQPKALIGQESAPKPPPPLKDCTCKKQVRLPASGFSYQYIA
uniref:Small integral membrane protein 12 n=1 Tax=Timema shepardi TaxID=629360 RepID=A0A7R9ARI2_TIMSH|nr:unnamed protein product [Timema shepardi]